MMDKIIIASAVVALVCGIVASLLLHQELLAIAIGSGFITSLAYIVIGFISINRSLDKPSKQFYKAFASGLVLRFSLFIISLYAIHTFTNLSLIHFSLSFMLFYIIFQSLEIQIIWKKLELQKSK